MKSTATTKRLDELRAIYDSKAEEVLQNYFDFLKIPSISSELEFKPKVRECANWLVNFLTSIGFEIQVWETEGHHPIVYAQWLNAGKDKPTILIYNHYDVQPVDPLELWETPPFEPALKGKKVVARGAQDNKGQCIYVLQAIKSLLEETGTLPVNLKLVIEGEEEMGSVALMKIAKEKKGQLKADHLFIVDLGIPDMNTPAVTLGIRGIVSLSIEITGSLTDLHSGEHGGIVYNPNHALVELLSKLHAPDGKVLIPGFYDDIQPLTDEDKKAISFDFDESHYEQAFGAKAIGGEKEFSPLESCWTRPTCEINGISGGYAGPGFKTVIPAKATAKISCRLVPNQNPEKIIKSLKDFLQKNLTPGLHLEVDVHGGGPATQSKAHFPAVKAVAQAYSEVFEEPCKFIMAGGTISIVTELAQCSGADTVMLGLGLPEDQIHAPNELFDLERVKKGFLIITRSLEILGSEFST